MKVYEMDKSTIRLKAKRRIAPLIFHALLFACLATGCGKNAEDAGSKASPEPAKGPVNTTVVSFDQEKLFLSDVNEEIALRQDMARIANPRVRQDALDKIMRDIYATAGKYYVSIRVAAEYCANEGISIDAATRHDYENKLAKTFKVKSTSAIKEKLSPRQQALLDKDIDDLLLVQLARNDARKKAACCVTDEKVDDAIARYRRANEIAAQTNLLVYAHATNIWNRLVSRELTFEEAAADYSEIEDESGDFGDWGTFSASAFNNDGDRSFYKLLKTMKVGTFTPPVEVDNGLCIVRLDGVAASSSANAPEPSEQPEEGNSPLMGDVKLSRIFFRLPVIWNIPPREEMRKIISEAETEESVKKIFAEIASRHTIIFGEKQK